MARGLAGKDADLLAHAAQEHVELARPRHLVTEADATRALDAALPVENDVGPELARLGPVLFLFHEARRRVTVLVRELLELALSGLVADRAVGRMVDQLELQHVVLNFLNIFRIE